MALRAIEMPDVLDLRMWPAQGGLSSSAQGVYDHMCRGVYGHMCNIDLKLHHKRRGAAILPNGCYPAPLGSTRLGIKRGWALEAHRR